MEEKQACKEIFFSATNEDLLAEAFLGFKMQKRIIISCLKTSGKVAALRSSKRVKTFEGQLLINLMYSFRKNPLFVDAFGRPLVIKQWLFVWFKFASAANSLGT